MKNSHPKLGDRQGIIKTNGIICGPNVHIYRHFSKINHSCRPNGFHFFNADTIIVALVQPVRRGEEVTVMYFEKTHIMRLPDGMHQPIHTHFRFHCDCGLYQDPNFLSIAQEYNDWSAEIHMPQHAPTLRTETACISMDPSLAKQRFQEHMFHLPRIQQMLFRIYSCNPAVFHCILIRVLQACNAPDVQEWCLLKYEQWCRMLSKHFPTSQLWKQLAFLKQKYARTPKP